MGPFGMSIQGKLKAVGNFAGSFRKKTETEIFEPKDVMIKARTGAEDKEWTVLVYAEGRNRLAYSTNYAINDMEKTGSDENVNVVVQSTVDPAWNERFAPGMENVNTRRYYITKDDDKDSITSPVVGDLGEKVPLNTDTLADFLSWGMKKFPAKHYMVVVKKHGLGFAKTDAFVPLSARELDEALEKAEKNTGKMVDVLSFDSCSMSQMEVGYEIKEHAKVMAGSQEDIYAIDYPYENIFSGLKEKATTIKPQEVGKLIVEAHKVNVPFGIQTSINLEKLRETGKATKELIDTLIKEGVPRDVIYTDMLKTSSMEPQESRRFAFNFRDEMGFIQNLISDKNITSGAVKEKAKILEGLLSDSIIDHHIGKGKEMVKNGKGLNIFMPWKNPSQELKNSYESLKFQKDTDWIKLIDYVFEDKEIVQSFAEEVKDPAKHLSLSQQFGKAVIHGYKEYVSPYLAIACQHSPSCSQYGREAIEKHGLVQGGKMAFMRILGCNPEATGKYDPVPDVPKDGGDVKCNTVYNEVPPDFQDNNLPDVIIEPPKNTEKSNFRKRIETALIYGSKITGKVLGGLGGALISIPIGTAMGAFLGAKAGSGTINEFNKELLDKYHKDSVRQFAEIEKMVGMGGFKVHEIIKDLTSSVEITGKTLEVLKDKIPLEVTDDALKNLQNTIDDKKLEMLKAVKNKKIFKEKMAEGLKKLSFSEREIELVMDATKSRDGFTRIDSMKPLIDKKLSEKNLKEELAALNFSEKGIDVIINHSSHVYNKAIAGVIGGIAGTITGILLGTAGAAITGCKWGSRFTGLFAQNLVKDKLGEMPKHPATEKILQSYYK